MCVCVCVCVCVCQMVQTMNEILWNASESQAQTAETVGDFVQTVTETDPDSVQNIVGECLVW